MPNCVKIEEQSEEDVLWLSSGDVGWWGGSQSSEGIDGSVSSVDMSYRDGSEPSVGIGWRDGSEPSSVDVGWQSGDDPLWPSVKMEWEERNNWII